jgi:hypothetical protein
MGDILTVNNGIQVGKFVPGPVGNAFSAISMAQNLYRGNLIAAGLDAVGAIPVAGTAFRLVTGGARAAKGFADAVGGVGKFAQLVRGASVVATKSGESPDSVSLPPHALPRDAAGRPVAQLQARGAPRIAAPSVRFNPKSLDDLLSALDGQNKANPVDVLQH